VNVLNITGSFLIVWANVLCSEEREIRVYDLISYNILLALFVTVAP